MSGDLLDHQQSEAPHARVTRESPLDRLMRDPGALKEVPIATVTELYRIHESERDYTARSAFHAAFATAQSEMGQIAKRGWNKETRSHHALLEDVVKEIKPILHAHRFSWSVSEGDGAPDGEKRYVLLLRREGHEERHWRDLPCDDKGPKGGAVKTRIHGWVSAGTYAERTLLVQVCGLQVAVGRDDDGNRAGSGPSIDPITPDQARDLDGLIDEVTRDTAHAARTRKRLLDHYRIEQLEALPAGRLSEATTTLESMR